MIEAGECFEGELAPAADRRVVASKEASEGVAEEGSALELGVYLRAEVEGLGVEEHGVDREVDIAGFEAVGEALGHGDDGEIDRRRFVAQALQKRRQDQRVEQVG